MEECEVKGARRGDRLYDNDRQPLGSSLKINSSFDTKELNVMGY
jgi:hypothetical protein